MALDDTTQERESRGPFALEVVAPNRARIVRLPDGGTVVIGRSRSADILIDDESMSRAHAELAVGDQVTIADLGSRNGTFVRGLRLATGQRVALAIGDPIELGHVLVRLARAESAEPPRERRERRVSGSGRSLLDSPEAWYASSSAAMQQMFEAVERVAPSDLSVLILGETGVGKELCAEQIHRRSPRARATLLRLNCSAIPEALLESELFGYERGAFTGASLPKPGLIESADGGTVFLDEIGELPATVQVKLLRVLDRREVMRLGDVKARTVDVRFVAATHRSLDAEIASGRFRQDLLYRLAGMTIRIPPLRERLDELPSLAERFACDAALRLGREAPRISPLALDVLAAYDWPGNIRELRNVMERAVVVCSGGAITPRDLELGISLVPPSRAEQEGLRGEVAGFERERVLAALDAAGGNRSEAARRLKMSRGALLARLRAWGIGPGRRT